MSFILLCENCDKYTRHSLKPDQVLECMTCGQPGAKLEETLTLGEEVTQGQTLTLPLTVGNGEEMCAAVLNEVKAELLPRVLERLEALELKVSRMKDDYYRVLERLSAAERRV